VYNRESLGHRTMKRLSAIICALLLFGLVACSESPASLYDNARFEELQNNREHALRLYRELLREHPESPYAAKARERLEELGVESERK
jgi:hypothetical protein